MVWNWKVESRIPSELKKQKLQITPTKEDKLWVFSSPWDFQSNSFSWFLLMVKIEQHIWIILISSSEEAFKFDFQPWTFSWNHGIPPGGEPAGEKRHWYRPYKLWVFWGLRTPSFYEAMVCKGVLTEWSTAESGAPNFAKAKCWWKKELLVGMSSHD